MAAKRTPGPGQPEPPPWPEAPAGWRWSRKGCPCQLEGPDGWTTANYNYPERALAEAQRRILSEPKKRPIGMAICVVCGLGAAGTRELAPQGQLLWFCMGHAPEINNLRNRGWSFVPAAAPEGWLKLVHPDLSYGRNEPNLAEAMKAAIGLQANFDRRQKLQEQAMTAATMSVEEGIRQLRKSGFSVKPHGARYLVGATSADVQPLTADEVINLAATHAWLAGESPAESPAGWTATCGSCGQSFISDKPVADGAMCPSCVASASSDAPAPANDGSMPIVELFTALEAHAGRIAGLAPDKPIPLPAGLPDRLQVPIDLVVSGRYQPRTVFEDTALGELADSIREHGILRAPIVFGNERGKIELIGGERRIRAARLAGLSMVPVEFRSYTMAQIAEISGLDNFHAAELSPIEKGHYFNRLMKELGMSENALAKRLGLPRTHIQQCRAVASAAPELHKAISEGVITFSHARTIAQSAAGEHKAQKQALALIAERIRNGRTVTEGEVKTETEKIIRKRLEGDLKKLGWQITGWGEIWSPSERPKAWTGAEMIEAVKTQRRPIGVPLEGVPVKYEVSAADLQVLQWQHDQVSQVCEPWIGLRKSYSGPWSYVAPDEVPALVQTSRAAMEALQARVKPHGFTIDPGKSTYTRLEVKGKHVSQVHYSWGALEGCVKQIEAGELVDRPREQQNNASARQQHGLKCDGCKKTAPGGLQYFGPGKNLCAECRVPVLAQQKAEREAREARRGVLGTALEGAIGVWLRAAPAGALPLIIGALSGEVPDDTSTADWVLDATLRTLLELNPNDLDAEYEESPTARALTERIFAKADQQLVELEHQVDAEPLLLGDIPADSPLAPIEAAVLNIHHWYKLNGATASDEEIAVNYAELRTLSNDLDGLSDDEAVSDEQFEMLTTAIGKLAEGLRELREERAVAA